MNDSLHFGCFYSDGVITKNNKSCLCCIPCRKGCYFDNITFTRIARLQVLLHTGLIKEMDSNARKHMEQSLGFFCAQIPNTGFIFKNKQNKTTLVIFFVFIPTVIQKCWVEWTQDHPCNIILSRENEQFSIFLIYNIKSMLLCLWKCISYLH